MQYRKLTSTALTLTDFEEFSKTIFMSGGYSSVHRMICRYLYISSVAVVIADQWSSGKRNVLPLKNPRIPNRLWVVTVHRMQSCWFCWKVVHKQTPSWKLCLDSKPAEKYEKTKASSKVKYVKCHLCNMKQTWITLRCGIQNCSPEVDRSISE